MKKEKKTIKVGLYPKSPKPIPKERDPRSLQSTWDSVAGVFPWEGVLRWEGLLCHRGDTVSLYSVADGGGLLLLPIAGRVPRPRGGMVCPPRPAPSPQSHQGPPLRLDGGIWSDVMSLQSLSLPSLKWGSVSWTRGVA